MLLSSAQKVTHYAQYMPITTAIMSQFMYNLLVLMTMLAYVRLQPVMLQILPIMLCYIAHLRIMPNIVLIRKPVLFLCQVTS